MAETMRDAFWNKVYEEMKQDSSIWVLTADFGAPMLDRIRSDFPDRFLSVGISEQNLINVAAGLALEGRRVFAYAIAPFFVRAAEQIRINLCMTSAFRKMNVTLIGVGIGFSYVVSGPSHHALEDAAVLGAFPGMNVITPSDAASASGAFELTKHNGVRYLRFDSLAQETLYDKSTFVYPENGCCVLQDIPGADFAIAACGSMTHTALELGKIYPGLKVVDVFQVTKGLPSVFRGIRKIFTLEEAVTGCGALDSKIQFLCPEKTVIASGVKDFYDFVSRNRASLRSRYGLSMESLTEKIRREIGEI